MTRIRAKRLVPLLALTVLAAVRPEVAVGQTIDTHNGATVYGVWETGPVSGESFIAPNSSILSASLFLSSQTGGSSSFYTVLQAYNAGTPLGSSGWTSGGGVAGPELFRSAVQTVAGTGMQRFEFDLGGITLTPGSLYAFYSVTVSGGIAGYAPAGLTNNYADGQAVYSEFGNGQTPSAGTSYDASFIATFAKAADVTATPEPASFALLATGLVGIYGAARRRRKTQTT